MKKFIFLFVFSLFIKISFAQTKGTQFPSAAQYSNTNLIYKIIDSPNNTFGYDIFAGKQKMIHQPSIPGMPGNEGFKTKPDAENVAKLVITKIKKGEMPPTVTTDELKKLNAVK